MSRAQSSIEGKLSLLLISYHVLNCLDFLFFVFIGIDDVILLLN